MMNKAVKNLEELTTNPITENNYANFIYTPVKVKENILCPYCQGDDSTVILSCGDDWDQLKIYISQGALWAMSGDYDIFETCKINFCPMCGRRL